VLASQKNTINQSSSSSSCLHDRAIVRKGAEIGLLSLRLSVSQGASLGDFLLAPACPIEKVTLWEGFLYLTSGSETDEGVMKDKGIEPGAPGPKPSTLSTSHPNHGPNHPNHGPNQSNDE